MKKKILSLLVLLAAAVSGAWADVYEVQIGEGTSTIGYHPFYTLYNYSISESLYLASELTEAGVEAGAITSLSWYATNQPGHAQQGISIWMANVSDTELTTSSHLATGMTQVYTNGTVTPVIGWNEFQCNGDFSWDGTSNLLILVQRNNGEWNSTVYWQATSGLSFNCMAYRYQDSNAYDVTASNEMYTSTTRPNIIIKGESAADFSLTKAEDAEAHGTISFKVVEGEKLLENATKSKEGNMVIVTIAPETGWAVGEVNGEWYAAVAAARRSEGANEDASNATIELLKDFGPEFADEVEGSGTKTYAFTMQRANAEISVKYQKLLTHTDISIFDIQPVTYNGQEQTPAIIVKDDQTVLVQDKDYTVEYSDNTDAGTGTATITGIGAYAGQVEKPIIINKADITTTAPTAVTELTYNAQPQTLISAGTAEDAEMLYSLDGENYSTELPAATDAKEYTVYFKVEGDKNHNDVNVQAIKVTIAQAELTAATLASTNLVYNQQEQTVEVASVSAGTLEVPENGFDVAGDKATAVGTYTATIKGKGNFKGEVTAQFSIVAADAQLFSLTLATTEFTYTGKELNPAVTVKDGEGNLVNYVDYTVAYSANVDAGTATVTVTGQGNYSGTQTTVFTISKAPLTVTAGDASVIYANEAPQFTVTYEGFVNNETNDVLSGAAAFTCEYTVESPVGSTFAITPGGLTSNNYDITFVPGTLTVVTDPASVAVMEKIDAIGEVVYTSECHALIDFVRTDYDALTAAQKTLVTNYGVLTAAEAKYAELKADYEAAADAITKIALIGEVAYTDVCKELIDAARAAYDALTDAQKALVGNLDVLTADEAKYAELAATGIKSLNVNANDNWYDLNGRKVANGQLKKGIYIKNGRKVVIK